MLSWQLQLLCHGHQVLTSDYKTIASIIRE